MDINNKKDIENAIAYIKCLLDNEIFDGEDEPYIKLILDYIENLENKIKKYEYEKIPYLKGYTKGLKYKFEFGYDMKKKSKLDINTGE